MWMVRIASLHGYEQQWWILELESLAYIPDANIHTPVPHAYKAGENNRTIRHPSGNGKVL